VQPVECPIGGVVMGWAEDRARLLNPDPPAPRQAFSPALPHFVQTSPTTWIETPYAAAMCVFCPNDLAEGDKICCPKHREILDATPCMTAAPRPPAARGEDTWR
jgi:hypothetical protein